MSDSAEPVFVNVIEVDPKRYEELMAMLQEANDSFIRHRKGFISCLLLASPDRSRVVTVARWNRADAIREVGSEPGKRLRNQLA